MTQTTNRSFWAALGPGILFAGAAIGTSHLVQSTRAGAMYGLGLVGIVIFANLIKYPFFRFGPRYAAATGMSLIEGYRRIGPLVLLLVALMMFAVHVIVIAATAITTAGIGLASFGLTFDARATAVGFIILGLGLMVTGGYHLLDRVTKVFVAILTVTTLVATALVIPDISWSVGAFALPPFSVAAFAFAVALMGFMPSGMELSVLHSCWSVAKQQDENRNIDAGEAMLDFNIGYVMTALLALCFVFLGAGVMHTSNVEPAGSAVAFASQVISLYTSSLGAWAGVIVGVSAFGVMFTTLVTVLDGFPRLYATIIQSLLAADGRVTRQVDRSPLMVGLALFLSAGAIAVLALFMRQFTGFIDFVTISAFVIAPVIALFNHIAMTSRDVPPDAQPSLVMQAWSWLGITMLSAITFAYLYLRFDL